ncbi:MAG: TolC family protein [Cyclobacteriaceae bacterium]|nr:TolC family protein [Cyclobacteriaceae bacterium]
MNFRIIIYLTAVIISSHGMMAQKLSLQECLTLAEQESPLAKQKLYFESMEALTQKNVSSGFLPTFSINGQASYQSDVFSFPNNPAFDSPIIPKDQYRITLDVQQKIYDGGLTKNKKIAESARIANESSTVEVDLYEIKETITQLFFSTLIYQENIIILRNLLTDLGEQRKKIEAQVANGMVLPGNLLAFKKQILSVEQQILSAEMEQVALLDMLGQWIGRDLDTADELQVPNGDLPIYQSEIDRPEIRLLKSQDRYWESMKKLSESGTRPMLWAVAQGGVGQPNTYNFLETDLSDFYFIGLKLSWQLFDYGNGRREKEIYAARQGIVQSKLEHLTDNFDRKLTREYMEVRKLEALVAKDEELLLMQNQIVASAFSQLSNGVITPTEYLSELNSQTQLEVNRKIHLLKLKQAQYNCLNITGKL